MKKENKITISLGLETPSGEHIDKDYAIQIVSKALLRADVLGFKIVETTGFWNGVKEKSLDFVFINTFDLTIKDLKLVVEWLRDVFEQEAVLLEVEEVKYSFI